MARGQEGRGFRWLVGHDFSSCSDRICRHNRWYMGKPGAARGRWPGQWCPTPQEFPPPGSGEEITLSAPTSSNADVSPLGGSSWDFQVETLIPDMTVIWIGYLGHIIRLHSGSPHNGVRSWILCLGCLFWEASPPSNGSRAPDATPNGVEPDSLIHGPTWLC